MTVRKVLLVCFSLVFLVIICFQKEHDSKVDRTLEKISIEERLVLSDFFRELIENNCFGYTLYGNKPVSFVFYFMKAPHSVLDFLQDKTSYMIHRGQKIWIKHKSAFDSKDFILKFEVKRGNGQVYLINKSAFLSCVSTHLDMFQKYLGSHITPESLLNSIAKDGVNLDSLVHNNTILEGILLGYGKHNALLHERYLKIERAMTSLMPPPWKEKKDLRTNLFSREDRLHVHINKRYMNISAIETSQVMPREGFASLVEEYKWFNEKYSRGSNLLVDANLSHFYFPGFCIDAESDETQNILAHYIDVKKKLCKVYWSGDFLSITLKKLTGEF